MAKIASGRERRVSSATHPLAVGAFGVVAGTALCVVGADEAGAVLTLAGFVMMVWGLHRLGRLGADPPPSRRVR